ncbi:protein of unknown function [Pararobbsia alpina]
MRIRACAGYSRMLRILHIPDIARIRAHVRARW